MRKYLLPEHGTFYKANMHCHSTLSDGEFSPEKLKGEYMKRGYSVIAFSDHEKFYTHNELSDDRFLAVNSYEIDISNWDTDDGHYVRCYHFNAYALNNGENAPVLPKPDYKDTAAINRFIQKLNESGYLVCYNHPYWSMQTLDDYRELEGLFGMEIFNYSAYIGDGIDGNQTQVYETMLRLGKRLFCLATDDNHDRKPIGHPHNDSFGGFIMIKAESLDYGTVMKALQAGSFYASAGPAIEELYAEDGVAKIKCSPAVRITMNTAGRRGGVVNAPEGNTVTGAEFTIDPRDRYIRFEVMDERGRRANSRAYFLDELNGGDSR